jgi:hypothetical protein
VIILALLILKDVAAPSPPAEAAFNIGAHIELDGKAARRPLRLSSISRLAIAK